MRSSEVNFSKSVYNALQANNDKPQKSIRSLKQVQPNPAQFCQSQRGMTLLEMLVALAVVAIVLTVVAPSVQTIISKNRTTSEINELSAAIQFARFNAIDQSSRAVVCPAPDFAACSANWNQAKIVFIDNNGNGARDDSEALLFSTTAIATTNTMTGPSGPIVFYESGATNASASIKICPDSKDSKLARSININAQGRVRLSTDSDKNDIFEDTDGNELSCS
jgi:type IV fimbrial biogenesis protein FimT